MLRKKLVLLLVCIASGSLPSSSAVADWPQFLGASRNGIVDDSVPLVNAFPAAGPKELWRVAAGPGQSGIAVAEDRCLTMWLADGKQMLVSLNALTGETIWQTPVGPEYKNSMGGNGPRATPTIAEKYVFAYTGEGILVAADLATGKVAWTLNVPEKLGGKPAEYGMASSPLVHGENVIVTAGTAQAAVIAVNQQSGKVIWKAGSSTAGYSSPTLLNVAGKPQIVALVGKAAIGLNPDTGAELWSYPFETDYDCNTANPVAIDGDIILSAGENHGTVRLHYDAAAAEPIREVWSSFGGQSVLRSEWQTPLVLDGKLYGFDNVGSAGAVTHLAGVDAATGKSLWKETRFGKANAIYADNKMIAASMKGELILGRLTPEGYSELARAKILDATRQAPALTAGKVYLRDDRQVVCIDLQKN